MFDWKGATINELAKKIATIKSSHVQSQIDFYTLKKDNATVEKILTARKLAVAYRLRIRADLLLEELKLELGEDIANSSPEADVGLDR